MTGIKSPEEFYGFRMGADRKLARWDRIVEYFWHLDESPCVKVVELGKSTEGNPFLLAAVSSPENIGNLERIRQESWDLAHPESLPEERLEAIIGDGKAVVSMTMSVHATEIGGTQLSSELAYEVATSDDPDIAKIREGVVFLLVPSSNPDGNIKVVDWYDEQLGTEYEGGPLPFLYHKYVGHDNNRDAFHITQEESKHLTRFLFREWYPQAQIDFHHTSSYGARFSIPPHMDPLYDEVDPLVWTEQQFYGGAMIMELEAHGKTGVETQATYPADGGPYWDESPIAHCICGMLTESASAKLATPIYVHYQQLEPARRGRPEYRTQMSFPHPWPGGWWGLRDIVEQQKIAALAVLKSAANFREKILRNMHMKALRQIERGRTEPPYAFIIPREQHDPVTASELLTKLKMADVTVHVAEEPFESEGAVYPAGTHVVFTAQACRAYILKLLRRTFYHYGPWSQKPDGTPLPPYDLSTDTLAEFMGVRVLEAPKPFEGRFEECAAIQLPEGAVEDSKGGYLLDGRLNASFKAVNGLLKSGSKVYRVLEPMDGLPVGAFYIPKGECSVEELDRIAKASHVVLKGPSAEDFEMKRVTSLRVGVYQRYWGGNIDEGWTRWVLEQHGFDYVTVMDEEVKEGGLNEKYDALIIPSDDRRVLLGKEKEVKEYYEKTRPKYVEPKYPPEYRSGLGDDGVEKLKEYVEAGGTLLTFGKASELAIEDLKLPVNNVLKDLKPKEFLCPGSTLKVKIDADHPLAYGVADDTLILFKGYPAFEVKKAPNNEDYGIVVSYPEERMLQSGWLIGEEHLSNKAALIDARHGKGRIILYGFSPQMRGITAATFKLLFNALIRTESYK